MQVGKFNVVTDGQWGSTGKGLITTFLASKFRPGILSTTNMANAGHTAVHEDGERKFIAKALPSAAILNNWIEGYNPHILIGPTAAFHLDQLLKEIYLCGISEQIGIHPRAGVITEEHRRAETDLERGTKHIASTMQGCGTFLADKIMRRKDLKLARDYEQLHYFMLENMWASETFSKIEDKVKYLAADSMPLLLNLLMDKGLTILHEGSQGFSLDINLGSHFPQCTSRSTTAVQNLSDMGLAPKNMGSVYLVIRPYPIRVGNVVEDGQTVGYSGDCYCDHKETTWEDVAKDAGAPPEVTAGELTTVTKRLRRVFTFSRRQVREAVVANGATFIALNFANYIDWSCYGTNDYDALPPKVIDFIKMLEDLAGIPVNLVGTGPRNDHVCFR